MLFDALRLRSGASVKNRAWLAPMTNSQSHADGTLGEDELAWLRMRAHGGFGVIESCAAHVARDGQGWEGELGIFDDAQLPGLERLAGELRAAGALGFVQLFHGGVRAPAALIGEAPWSASAVAISSDSSDLARPATLADIERVIGQFRDGAVRAHAAGFDGVELHGAHGYLLGQFLSATMNQRTDAWGGSLDGRAKLVRETLRAVRKAVPASFTVGVRISPEDFGNARGLDLDESLDVARWLAADGADFVHLSLWNSKRNTRKRPEEHAVPLFRAALPADVALVVAGDVWTRDDAEALLAMGASAVAVGRAAIVNPAWARDVATPGWEPRRPPVTLAELRSFGLSETFATYMRQWKNFVTD